jgi:heme/copper-type cytochrome/quinol oxidase subunit 2
LFAGARPARAALPGVLILISGCTPAPVQARTLHGDPSVAVLLLIILVIQAVVAGVIRLVIDWCARRRRREAEARARMYFEDSRTFYAVAGESSRGEAGRHA